MSPTGVLAAAFLFLALYCGLDPLKQSLVYDLPDFETYAIDLPSWSEVPPERNVENSLQRAEVKFLNEVQGPESVAFDPQRRGPYTGVADGSLGSISHIRQPVGISIEVHKVACPLTSENFTVRSNLCDWKPTPFSYMKDEHICGRPLGLRFYKRTGDLYIADAYFGLMKVGPEGGLATSLATEAEGVPLTFTNDLDIDEEGNVYFTDSSTKYRRRNFMQLVFSAENSGRLLKYDPVTNETTVLLRNLQFPNGVSLSKDGTFFVFSEGAAGRLRRYWLKGEKAGTSDVLAVLPGFPDNVRTNKDGEFWVAMHCRRSTYAYYSGLYPKLRKFWLRLPIPAKYQFRLQIGGRPHAVIAKYGTDGKLLQILEDSEGKVVRAVSEVEEMDGKLWIGSVLMPFLAVYNLS